MKENFKETLMSHIGKVVCVENFANVDLDETKVNFNLAGTLEYNEDEENFYVRIGEHFVAGAVGVGFKINHIKEVRKLYHGDLQITLY